MRRDRNRAEELRQTIHVPGVGEVEIGELRDAEGFEHDPGVREVPRELAASAPTDVHVHFVYPPTAIVFEADWQRDAYLRIHPFLWFACEHPDRAADEAMLVEPLRCRRCLGEWGRRGLPLPFLPPLPADAPRLR